MPRSDISSGDIARKHFREALALLPPIAQAHVEATANAAIYELRQQLEGDEITQLITVAVAASIVDKLSIALENWNAKRVNSNTEHR